MTWTRIAAPSIGSVNQLVTLRPVQDDAAGVDFVLRLTQRGDFVVSSDCPVRISSTTILEP